MVHGYDKTYLDEVMRNLGEAMDYVVHACHMEMDRFLELFIAEGFASQMEAGVPRILVGLSGTELVCEVMGKANVRIEFPQARWDYGCSKEYWCGWILAYYQWFTGKSFKDIRDKISMEDIANLYPALHEASEDKFVDIVNSRFEMDKMPTQLQMLRRIAGYSQRLLAEKSGVNIRNIQQYEQRVKDINKAAGITLAALARSLGCHVEDLLECDVTKQERC